MRVNTYDSQQTMNSVHKITWRCRYVVRSQVANSLGAAASIAQPAAVNPQLLFRARTDMDHSLDQRWWDFLPMPTTAITSLIW